MRKITVVIGALLLAVTLLTVGCTKPAATPPAASPPKVTVTEGSLSDVNVPKSTVTIETPQGPQSFSITSQTTLTYAGRSCSLEELADLEASGDTFNCSVVYDTEGNVAAINVIKVPKAVSYPGRITDVNIKESTITVKTASGDRIVEVDPDTGLLIGGVACSLGLIDAYIESGGELPCTVIATTDDLGNALYIDIANPPGLTQSKGTIEKVDIVKSTVTIMTDKGERTFEIDAKTGAFLNGEVCSIAEIDAATEAGETLTSCQVLFYTDKDGKLIYIDISTTVTP